MTLFLSNSTFIIILRRRSKQFDTELRIKRIIWFQHNLVSFETSYQLKHKLLAFYIHQLRIKTTAY